MSFEAFFKGWLGEQGTRLAQWLALDSKEYHVFYDVLVKFGDRSTQIDHVIVSKYGVFVVETKKRTGWIFGESRDSLWTQQIFNSKTRFQNPLVQNKLHIRAIADFCAIDSGKIHSVVVFWGDCNFKTGMPENVVKWPNYIKYIKNKRQVILDDREVERICDRLDTIRGGIPIISNILHAQEIKKQYKDTEICPKCGGNLLERRIRAGQAAGQKFIGCENYPKCRFTRNF